MDESIIPVQTGKVVPEWSLRHRLPVDRPVGPDLWDGGTVFSINSIYMDVTEQPFMERQWSALGSFFSLSGVAAAWWYYHFTHIPNGYVDLLRDRLLDDSLALIMLVVFGRFAYIIGRTVFFSLKNRPIRFNREARKIYAIRRRRFFRKPGQGDVVAEADWNKDAIFCIHRETTNFGRIFHIRHYKVDAEGKVIEAFSIGREWSGEENVRTLLAQWNYWCHYMNDGPATLPKPMLFLPTRETLSETFFFAMYTFGFTASGTWRLITMPFTLLLWALRALSLATCRYPVWPDAYAEVNRVDPNDQYAEPSGRTPVGWAATIRAQERGEYPEAPKGEVRNWRGSRDGVENARLWVMDDPPKGLAGA